MGLNLGPLMEGNYHIWIAENEGMEKQLDNSILEEGKGLLQNADSFLHSLLTTGKLPVETREGRIWRTERIMKGAT